MRDSKTGGSAMSTLRFGTIGTNFITDRLILNGRKVPDFELAAVYSRTRERGLAYARKQGIDTVFTSLEDLAAYDGIDAVYIGSPNCCHASQAITLLNAGKHVLCEKPMCSNYREMEAMYRAAEQNGVVLLEAMRPWYTPGFRFVEELLPEIGPVRHATFYMCQYSSRYNNFKNGIIENAFVRELSNGAIMDIGCYAIGAMTKLFGMPSRIESITKILPGSIDSQGAVLAEYSDLIGECIYSKVSGEQVPNIIQGEKATILVWPVGSFEHIEIIHRDGRRETKEFPAPDFAMNYEVEEFIRLCRGQGSTAAYTAASRAAMQIMDTVRSQAGYDFPADHAEE